jgi:hypothetical protein
MNDLVADERRLGGQETGIPVRARTESGWDAVDIAHLTRESLWQWALRTIVSRRSEAGWAHGLAEAALKKIGVRA